MRKNQNFQKSDKLSSWTHKTIKTILLWRVEAFSIFNSLDHAAYFFFGEKQSRTGKNTKLQPVIIELGALLRHRQKRIKRLLTQTVSVSKNKNSFIINKQRFCGLFWTFIHFRSLLTLLLLSFRSPPNSRTYFFRFLAQTRSRCKN